MDERGFDIPERSGVISALTEIGVLIDGAGDQTGDFGGNFGVETEDEGEGGSEGRGGLHGWEEEFGNVVAMGRKRWVNSFEVMIVDGEEKE